MTATAAVYHEVRYRELGTESWSDITRAPVTAELAVDGLDREKTYEFQVRAVSACGAKSVWVSGNYDTLTRTGPLLSEVDAATVAAQTAADNAQAAADDAAAQAAAANATLGKISSDAWLTASEKPAVMREHQAIGQQIASVQASADAYGVSRTAHDAAKTALDVYLGGLTPAWNNTTTDTPIVSATFNQKFADYYKARQELLDAISGNLGVRADAAMGPNLAKYTFFDGIGRWINEIGTTDGITNSTTSGYLSLAQTVGNNPGGNCNFFEGRTFEASAGIVFYATVRATAASSTHDCVFGVQWLNSTGGQISVGSVGTWTAGGAIETKSASLTAPAGAVSARLTGYITSGSVGDRFQVNYVFCQRDLLMQPGSGAQLGDARNQAMVTVGNFAAAWDGLSVTYTSTTTSVTFTASAATLQAGDIGIAYGQSSKTVSGTAGSTVTYYLYYDDPTFAGGARTLNATTTYINSINSNGRVYIAKATVTYPTSGTGSGGGATGPCVAVDARVIRRAADGSREDVRAGDIRAGDYLLLVDGRWGLVTYSEAAMADRVRVAGRGALTCSTSAPLGLAGGGQVLAPDALGAVLDSDYGPDTITSVDDAGPGLVQHITCENTFFWARDAGSPIYYSHHNAKPPL